MEIIDQFENISIRFNNLMNRGNKNVTLNNLRILKH